MCVCNQGVLVLGPRAVPPPRRALWCGDLRGVSSAGCLPRAQRLIADLPSAHAPTANAATAAAGETVRTASAPQRRQMPELEQSG